VLGTAADELVANELHEIEVVEQVLGNAHSEDIQLWAEKIRRVVAKSGDISLLDLQRHSRLSLVDLWLGLLLGDTGCWLQRGCSDGYDRATNEEHFYEHDGIWVLQSGH
jgi:hypothetical protein